MGTNENSMEELLKKVDSLTGRQIPCREVPGEETAPQILLIGQPQQNLFGLLGRLCGGMPCEDAKPPLTESSDEHPSVGAASLNRALFRGFQCDLSFGEEEKFFLYTDGKRVETTGGAMAELLSSLEMNSTRIQFEIMLDWPILREVSLSVLASAHDYEDVDWTAVRSDYDYYLFTLMGTALLSMCERNVLRRELLPDAGSALGITVANWSLLLEEDQTEVEKKIVQFFQKETMIFYDSEDGRERCQGYLASIPEKTGYLREERSRRIKKDCLGDAAAEVVRYLEALTADSARLDDAVELLEEKAKRIPDRQEATFRRMRIQYTTHMKVGAAERFSKFNQDMSEQLRQEIQKEEDIGQLQQLLPRYIRDMWEAKVQEVQNDLVGELGAMQDSMETVLAKDIREYLEEGTDGQIPKLILKLVELYPIQAEEGELHFQELKDGSRMKRYGVIAAGVTLVLMSHPIVGAAVAVFGSKTIRKEENRRLLEANRQGLYEEAEAYSHRCFGDVTSWLDDSIAGIESEMSERIGECYQKITDTLIQALSERKRDQRDQTEHIAKLSELGEELEKELETMKNEEGVNECH